MYTAKDIMTREPITVTLETTVEKLAATLWEKGISGAPVVDAGGGLVGVVSESDLIDQNKKVHIPTVVTILDSVIFLENPAKVEKEIRKMAGITVADIYTRDPITIGEDTPLEEVASIMSEKHVHTLPVLNAAGRLVGVVGKRDIIRTMARKS